MSGEFRFCLRINLKIQIRRLRKPVSVSVSAKAVNLSRKIGKVFFLKKLANGLFDTVADQVDLCGGMSGLASNFEGA